MNGRPIVLAGAGPLLEEIVRRAPDADDLTELLAVCRHLQGRFDDEVRLYRTVLGRNPRNPEVLNNLAWALAEGLHRPDEALPLAEEAVQLSGRNASCLDTRGMILLRLGRLPDAIADLTEASRSRPTGSCVYHLALAYRKAGKEEEFRKTLDQVRKAGLTAERVDRTERAEFESLLKL